MTPGGKIAPTETTCLDFINWTAGDINEIPYGLKSGTINNSSSSILSQSSCPGYRMLGWGV